MWALLLSPAESANQAINNANLNRRGLDRVIKRYQPHAIQNVLVNQSRLYDTRNSPPSVWWAAWLA